MILLCQMPNMLEKSSLSSVQSPGQAFGDSHRSMWRMGELFLPMLARTRLRCSLHTRLDRSRVVRGVLAIAKALDAC